MTTLVQRLFPTPEVKIVLSAYRDEIGRIRTVKANSVLGSVAGIELLNEEVKNAIHAGKDTVKQKIAAGKAPRVGPAHHFKSGLSICCQWAISHLSR